MMSCSICRPGTLLSKRKFLELWKTVKPKWKAPQEDFYKINCDGAFLLIPIKVVGVLLYEIMLGKLWPQEQAWKSV